MKWTLEAVQVFMKNYGFTPRATKPEIKELPSILSEGEELHGLLEGLLKRVHNRIINGQGLVIATNKRIIFFRKSIIGTVTREEFPISRVSSCSFRKGLLFSSVAVVVANDEAVVEQCDKGVGKRFSDAVQWLIFGLATSQAQQQSAQPQVVPVVQAKSNFEQLEKLHDLKEKGILSQEEYDKQKARLLA